MLKEAVLVVIVAAGLVPTAGCSIAPIVGEWSQPDEHLVASAACVTRCQRYQSYEVTWVVSYPKDLKLANFRCICRDIGEGHPCLRDEEIDIDDNRMDHRATIYWRIQSSAVAVRLVADQTR